MSFRPLNLPTPASSALYKLSVDEFKGVDKASGEDNFSPSRATDLQNFIRDKVGQVKKRGGFTHTGTYNGRVSWVERWHDHTITCEQRTLDDGRIESDVTVSPDGEDVWQFTADGAVISFAINDDFYIIYSVGGVYRVTGIYGKLNGQIVTALLTVREFALFEGMIGFLEADPVETAHLPIRPRVTTPVIVEGASPAGGGGLMMSPNILSPLVTETFTVTEDDLSSGSCKRFQLSLREITLTDGTNEISSDEWMKGLPYWEMSGNYRALTETGAAVLQKSVKIEKYVAVGSDAEQLDYEWQAVKLSEVFKAGQKDFVNTESAALWIPTAAIGASPVEGEANVRITYVRNFEEYEEGLAKLMEGDLSACYGVGGYKDRVFLSGGNKIFYSGMDDPLYFGELCYIEPCSADKSIVAMGGQGQVLYAVDSDGITHVISGTVPEDDSTTYLQDAAFIIADRVQGEKPVGSVLKIFGGEFCYLSEEGVVAIRHDNFYDKRYAQNRSRMLGDSIKGKIVGATVWGSFLVIATSDQLYLLDELQQTRLEDYKYSGVQYEVFPFSFSDALGNFKIENVWTEDDCLNMCVLQDGMRRKITYDEGALQDVFESNPCDITAEWITPQFSLADVHRRKLIQDFYLSVGTQGDAVGVEYQTDNGQDWRVLRPADGRFIPLWPTPFDYGTFSYYHVNVPKLQMIVRRRPARPFYKIRFRFISKGQHSLTLSSLGFYYKKEVI